MFDTNRTAQRDIEGLRDFANVFLGGSRRMDQRMSCEIDCSGPKDQTLPLTLINDDTDFDYYATFDMKAYEFLIRNGWTHTGSDKGYYDSEAEEILEKEDHQIVFRLDAEFYRKVFESIPVWFYVDYLWKRNPDVNRERIQPILEMLFQVHRGR